MPTSTSAAAPDAVGLAPFVRPKALLGLFATLAVIAVMVWLGLWQLGVSNSKSAAEAAEVARKPAVAFESLVAVDEPPRTRAVGRQVFADGTWQPTDQFYVSDRTTSAAAPAGARGTWVVTPLHLANGAAVLVVRGWSAADPSRLTDAAGHLPAGRVRVHGVIGTGEGHGELAASTEAGGAADHVLTGLRIPLMVGLVDYQLYDAVLFQASVSRELAPVAPPAPAVGGGVRNIAYGLQWFCFAAFALYLWWRVVRDQSRDHAE